ncbi:hypothetical protein [Halosolutus halophilus]|uniref:hypothetical protein n=1 Tax=Halosolutus halophilus TaxID=1552990 RepID=UPI002234F3DB|nr:hypothetical protein [Halosolutus halophilus]
MAFVAEVTVPPAAVSFGRVLDRHDDLTIELENVVPTQQGACRSSSSGPTIDTTATGTIPHFNDTSETW